ncbi:TPA: type 1 fimbrial protein [Escherichia coli]|uniref:fimbrial protein n=1 Tax=Escherichia coli TaxID=562 RepID=UPI001594269F|nr:spore coat protein U domain-containing protein [Escherichia coli]EFD2031738.1 type 1 fimbrial protein [Escherichia coli O157:H7]EFM9550200.1 type 1 fimbrial protein [Escherichia coli]EFN8884310.1 type 1 fimbrial protein [Escherichia coli]EIX2829650.1 type 1 fimbrial protein [Escherichia coli]EKH2414281.1 type 1 fimbrial protein [Escherichia coli]
MKKLTLVAAIVATAFAAGANAATTTASVNITGKITPSSCTISSTGTGGTIDFGTIKTSELTNAKINKRKSGNISVNCDNDTTAIIKVSGGNGLSADKSRFSTDKNFVDYIVYLKDISVTGGNAASTILVPTNTDAAVEVENLAATTFQKLGSGASAAFPINGVYFGIANSSSPNSVGTFRTLNATVDVLAQIDRDAAKAATSQSEQTFSSVVNFELNYI